MGILRKLFGKETTTDVLELLASQHAEVDSLFERIEKGEGDRGALFTELADKLAAHATAEEKVFYPAVMAKQTKELLQEAVELVHRVVQLGERVPDLATADIGLEALDMRRVIRLALGER